LYMANKRALTILDVTAYNWKELRQAPTVDAFENGNVGAVETEAEVGGAEGKSGTTRALKKKYTASDKSGEEQIFI